MLDLLNDLSALRALSELDPGAVEEPVLLREALRGLMHNQDMERSSVFLLRDDELVNGAGIDWDELGEISLTEQPLRSSFRFRIGEGLIGQAALTHTLQHAKDCRNDPRFHIKPGEEVADLPGTVISVPILSGKELLGVLNVSHPQPNFFDEWHERLLTVFCGLLGQLLKTSRLCRQMQIEIQRRTGQLEEALMNAQTLQAQFEQLSYRDELTGLNNRRYFFLEAESAYARAVRYQQPYTVILLDIDHFKKVNDLYGHAGGDTVLKAVSGILASEVRAGDILARFGGEEFIIAVPSTDLESSVTLATRIRAAVGAMTWEAELRAMTVSLSIGVSTLDHAMARQWGWSLDQLIQQADEALYEAKRAGRDRVVIFSTNQDKREAS